jgi:hypothetical protein
MSCYLCAYKKPDKPRSHQPLPAGSPAGAYDDLATCAKCSVWACSNHGTRYGRFQCAICTPAAAAAAGMTAGATAGAASSLAYLTGVNGDAGLRVQVHAAVARVAADSRLRQDVEPQWLSRPRTGTANLVTNLADEIREQEGGLEQGFLPAIREDEYWPPYGAVSIDAIGGAVREQFAGAELRRPEEPSDAAIATVTGALLLGYALADDRVTVLNDEFPVEWPQRVVSLEPPWQVSHPLLLDPVLWMLGTALTTVR